MKVCMKRFCEEPATYTLEADPSIHRIEISLCDKHSRRGASDECDNAACLAPAVVQDDVVGGSKGQWCREHQDEGNPDLQNVGGPVNHPGHYNQHPSGIECIDVVEHMSFNVGNAVKYLWRADYKDSSDQDLAKAKWYIQREIDRRAKSQRNSEARNKDG